MYKFQNFLLCSASNTFLTWVYLFSEWAFKYLNEVPESVIFETWSMESSDEIKLQNKDVCLICKQDGVDLRVESPR